MLASTTMRPPPPTSRADKETESPRIRASASPRTSPERGEVPSGEKTAASRGRSRRSRTCSSPLRPLKSYCPCAVNPLSPRATRSSRTCALPEVAVPARSASKSSETGSLPGALSWARKLMRASAPSAAYRTCGAEMSTPSRAKVGSARRAGRMAMLPRVSRRPVTSMTHLNGPACGFVSVGGLRGSSARLSVVAGVPSGVSTAAMSIRGRTSCTSLSSTLLVRSARGFTCAQTRSAATAGLPSGSRRSTSSAQIVKNPRTSMVRTESRPRIEPRASSTTTEAIFRAPAPVCSQTTATTIARTTRPSRASAPSPIQRKGPRGQAGARPWHVGRRHLGRVGFAHALAILGARRSVGTHRNSGRQNASPRVT